jgi:hypothetical protein
VRRKRAQLNVGIMTDQNGRETPFGTGGISGRSFFNSSLDATDIIIFEGFDYLE